MMLAFALPGRGAAQVVQYRTADGRTFTAMPDTGIVAAADRAYRRERTLENALSLGAAQSAVRQYRAAIETYTQALRHWPDAAVLYRWRGHRRLTLRDFVHAREDLQIAIDLDSTLYGAWYHLGVVEFINGDFDAAAAAFRRGVALAPDAGERAGSTDWLWQSLSRVGRHAAADSLLRARPDSIPAGNAYANRLRLYRGEIGPDALFTASDTAGVQRATLAFGVGSWYAARHEPERAREWFERAFREDDGWPAFGFIAAEAQLVGRTDWYVPVWATGRTSACVAALPRSAMVASTVRASASRTGPLAPPPLRDAEDQLMLLLQAAADVFRKGLGAATDGLPTAAERFTWRQLEGTLRLTAHRDGSVSWTVPRNERGEQSDETAVLTAFAGSFEALADAGAVSFAWPSGLGGDSVTTEIELRSPLTDPPGEAIQLPTDRSRVGFPLFSLLIPRTNGVAAIPGAGMPRYPVVPRLNGASAELIFRFVVDSSGLIMPQSVREIWRTGVPRQRGKLGEYYDRFRQAVLDAMPGMRFTPAEFGGCKVARVVQQPFAFALQP